VGRQAVTLVLALLVVAGCGGGDDEAALRTTVATTPAPTTTASGQTAWAAQADAICSAFQVRIDSLPAPRQPSEAATLARNTLVLARDELSSLRSLTPPLGQVMRVRMFLAALDRSIMALERLQQAAEAQDNREAQRAIQVGEAAGAAAARQGDLLGLVICGRAA